MQTERILVGILIVAGFLWLRHRARKVDEAARGRALLATAFFLVPALAIGKWLFEKLPYGLYENLAIELAGLAAVIAVAGLVFMKPSRSGRSGIS
jgi:hypothetical protein